MRRSAARPIAWSGRRVIAASLVAGVVLAAHDAALAEQGGDAPPRAASAPPSEAGAKTPEQTLADLRREQQALLAQVRRDIAALPILDPAKPGATAAERENERLRQEKLRLLAAIEKQINAENGRPSRRYISPATQEPVYRNYYQAMARRIEEVGTRDFPTSDGHKLYGDLTLNMTVDASGRVIATEVVRSSGNALLDRKATAIARAAGPFGPFGKDMHAKADEIVVTHRFRFMNDGPAQQVAPASDAQP